MAPEWFKSIWAYLCQGVESDIGIAHTTLHHCTLPVTVQWIAIMQRPVAVEMVLDTDNCESLEKFKMKNRDL